MFITEQQLALYKYQAGSKYFNKPMASIFSAELLEYAKNHQFYVVEFISRFLNRKVSSDTWKIYFSDESVALIKLSDVNKMDNSRGIEIQTFDFDIDPDTVFSG